MLDFTQAIAGPFLTRLLAENGAEVIKVESGAHQQRGRARPGLDPRIVLQQKVTFADMSRNKRSISVDMGKEEGRELIRKLIPLCDVVVENFSPRVMDGWGLGYEELCKLRSNVILLRLPGFGLTGPYRDYVGLAAVAMGITGMYYLWSYPDSPEPAGPPVWTPDYLSAAFGSVALMAALRHRDRKGQGQLIELSQVDATAFALGNVYLDYSINGRIPHPAGNRHPYLAPHGAYRCKGEDAWCTIAVRNEDEWQALCGALGSPRWAQEDGFSTMGGRLANQDELDRHIEDWTRDHTPQQVMYLLQKAGVPAGAVLDGERLFQDVHLRERGYITLVDDPDTGPVEYPGIFVRLSETPGRVDRCHLLGEDNQYVFGQLLEMPGEEITRLEREGRRGIKGCARRAAADKRDSKETTTYARDAIELVGGDRGLHLALEGRHHVFGEPLELLQDERLRGAHRVAYADSIQPRILPLPSPGAWRLSPPAGRIGRLPLRQPPRSGGDRRGERVWDRRCP